MQEPRIITGRGGVVYDDASIADEERHAEAQRAAIITQYGSIEAYDEWVLADVRLIRRERHRAVCRMRVERARMSRLAVAIHIPRRTSPSSGRPRARRASSSSTTAGTDPGSSDGSSDSDPEPPAALRLAPPSRAVLTFGVLS